MDNGHEAEVSPIEERHKLDLDSLARWMKDNVEDFRGPLSAQQFGIGQSNPTYRLDAGGKSYVLRRKPPGNLLPSAHAVDREYRIISALHPQGFPVAEPVLYCADAQIAGTA